MDFGIDTIRAAAERIDGRVRRTPLLSSPMLDQLTGAQRRIAEAILDRGLDEWTSPHSLGLSWMSVAAGIAREAVR